MAKHIRQLIREDFAARLSGHASLAGVQIVSNRSRPIHFDGVGKALQIINARESSTPVCSSLPPRRYIRTISMQVIGYVSDTDEATASNRADELAFFAEQALDYPDIPTAILTDCWLEQTDFALDPGSYANATFAQTWQVETGHAGDEDQ